MKSEKLLTIIRSIIVRRGASLSEICLDSSIDDFEVLEVIGDRLKSGQIEYNPNSGKYYLSEKLWHYWRSKGFKDSIPTGERSIWLDKSPVKDWYPSQTLPQPTTVYYIGPYREPYLSVYRRVIQPTIEDQGLICMTALDEPGSDEFLRNKILPSLLNARFVICDLSENNVNVHYELGWLHAFGTPFLTYTRSSRASDISHLTINSYKISANGLRQLQQLLVSSLIRNEVITNDNRLELDFETIASDLLV